MVPGGHLIPGHPVPDLSLPLAGGGSWRLSDQKPQHFTMVVFYRGMHCVMCREYLSELQAMHGAFRKVGVMPIAISADDAHRAAAAEASWDLTDLCVAYGLTMSQARKWGLYISSGRGLSLAGIEEPKMFVEPGLFLIRPDRTLYFASVQSSPFARPSFKAIMRGIEMIVDLNLPIRGELAADC
jgi:peroxiredoxin